MRRRPLSSQKGSVLVAVIGLVFILFVMLAADYVVVLSQIASSRSWDRRRQDRDARITVRAALREAYYLRAETAPNRSQDSLNQCVEAVLAGLSAQSAYSFLPTNPSPEPFAHAQYPDVSSYAGLTRTFDGNIEGAGSLMSFLHAPLISAAHYLGAIPFQFQGRHGAETFSVRVWSLPLSQFSVTAYGMPSLGESGVPTAPPSLVGYNELPRPLSIGNRLLVTTSDQSEDSTVTAEFHREDPVLDQSYRVKVSLAWNAYEWLWGDHYFTLATYAGASRSFEPSRDDWDDNPSFSGLSYDQVERTVTLDVALYPDDIFRVGPAGNNPVTITLINSGASGVNPPLVLLMDNDASAASMIVRSQLSSNPPVIFFLRNATFDFAVNNAFTQASIFLDPQSSVAANPGRTAVLTGSLAYYWQNSPFPGLTLAYRAVVTVQDTLAQRSPRAVVVSAF